MRRALCIVIAAVTAVPLLGVGSAAAHVQRRFDESDAGRLDVRRVRFSHSPSRITVRIRTEDRFRSRLLRGGHYVTVYAQTGRNARYFVTATVRDGKLRGAVDRSRRDFTRRRIGRAKATRPDRRIITLRFQRDLVRATGGRDVHWNVQTFDGDFVDVTPDSGTYRHRF